MYISEHNLYSLNKNVDYVINFQLYRRYALALATNHILIKMIALAFTD